MNLQNLIRMSGRDDRKIPDDALFPHGQHVVEDRLPMIFEQYKLAVDVWDRVRARRQQANAFYVTINSAIVTVMSAAPLKPLGDYPAIMGLFICALWFTTILNYRSLTNDKGLVVQTLEKSLPTSPFYAEWHIEPGNARLPRLPFTWAERCIPFAFALLYIAALAKLGYV